MYVYTFLADKADSDLPVSLFVTLFLDCLFALRKPKTKTKGCKMLYSSAELRQFTVSDSFYITHSKK